MNELVLLKRIESLEKLIMRQPEIGGVWTAYTPTITALSGTFTTVSATGYYSKIAKVVPMQIAVTITTNGTAAGVVIATLPFATNNVTLLTGRENAVTGKMLQGLAFNSQINIFNYDGSYPGGDGHIFYLSGFISIA